MIIHCFEENPTVNFKLIAVLDYKCIYPHQYKVIFQNMKTNEFEEEEIIPEYLKYDFIVGNIYRNYELVVENTETVNLNLKNRKFTSDKCSKIGKYIKFQESYNVGKFQESFSNQNCFYYYFDNKIYILPMYVIANRYYFLSTKIKKALSNGMFESLYYEDDGYYIDDDKKLTITLKKSVSYKHRPLIARMITSQRSRSNFKYFYRQSMNKLKNMESPSDVYSDIFLGFPFEERESFRINCNCITLGKILYEYEEYEKKYKQLEQEAILITNIFSDKIEYNYKTLDCQLYKQEQEDNIETDIFYADGIYPLKNKGTVNKKSSKRIKSKSIAFSSSDDEYDFSDINIIINEINSDNPIMFTKYTEDNEDNIPNSYDQPDSFHNKNNVREVLFDVKCEKNEFQLENFYILFEKIIEYEAIGDSNISEVFELKNFDQSYDSKFFINKDKNKSRKLIFGYFQINNKLVNFIEVEHDFYWNKNTWFFISDYIFDEKIVQVVLNNFINKKETYHMMHENIKVFGVREFFYTKHHGIRINDVKQIEQWYKSKIMKKLL